MNRVESIFYRIVGIQPESEKIKWYSVAFFEGFAKIDKLWHHTQYEGSLLPSEGPALVVCNHTSMWDTAKGYRVGQKSRRILRTFTRDTLLDPTKQESEKVKARTGHKSDLLNSGPTWLRRLIAAIPAGVEAIPIPRDARLKDLKDFLKRGKERFNAGLAVAIFSQETRNKDGRLVNPMPGAALLAQNNPDVPIYTMSIFKSQKGHHRVYVGETFTYNQMLKDPQCGELVKTSFTVFLNDRLADHLDPNNKEDWYENQRLLVLSNKKP